MSRDSYFATWLRFCLCNFAPVTRKIKTKDMDKKQLSRIALTAVLLFVAWMVTKSIVLPVWGQLLVYLVPYIIISYDVVGEAIEEGIGERNPFNEDFLMCVATIGALLIGFLPGAEPQFPEAVFVMLFFQVGELFEDYAEDRSKRSINDLMDIRPDVANVERGGEVTAVNPKTVAVGETVVVRPGEKVPMDGTITDGVSSLNTVALTGESVPRDVGVGDDVLSGCINISGVLRVKVGKSFGDSTASKIIRLVEESAENKSRSETFIRRFSRVYTPIVVFLAIGVAFIPPFFCDSYADGLATWVYRALSFLVVSCPCALVISVPLSFFGGVGGASRKGILIKGGNYMDALARLSTVVFDKTGTLTQGVFAVDAIHPEAIDADDLLHLTAHAEEYSTHPIASALRAAFGNATFKDAALGNVSATNIGELLADGCRLDNVKEIAGQGIRATVNGHAVSVGNVKLMEASGAKVTECVKCENAVGTIIHVAVDGVYAGHIVIADKVKADSRDAIAGLKGLGVEKTVMLTGDHERVAARVAEDLGLDEYHASLLPQDKVEWVERLISAKSNGSTLAFVGDGINDAPVLARADVGIAMGALGADAAIEAADVVLMDDKPSKIAMAVHIARRTIANARQNSTFAIAVKVVILVLVATGVLGSLAMPLAVFGDVGVMVLCVLNAMRTLRV